MKHTESIPSIEKNPDELIALLNGIEEVLMIYIIAIREYRKKNGLPGKVHGAK